MGSKTWPLTMAEAAHIARMPRHAGTDEAVAREYGVSENLIRQIRNGEGYNGVTTT